MALFKPYKITKNKLNSLPIKEGQFIIVTDTEEIYVDKSASERIKLGGGSGATNLVNGSGTGSIKMINAKGTQGNYAFAEGNQTTASGNASHAEGIVTYATALAAHAEGKFTQANGEQSHVEGLGTQADSAYQHVEGQYNIVDANGTYAHIIGNGLSTSRSNAHTIDWDGNAWYQGNIKLGGTSYDDATRTIAAYISGTAEPTSDIGEDGDIYILIEE